MNKLDDRIHALGLKRSARDEKKSEIMLSNNTFSGELEGESATNLRDDIFSKTEAIFLSFGLKGKIFVSVGGNWSWGIRNV
ncbi:hypothetical protein KFE98_19175 [bacterium SCSIO 12741]|nr:hypothetical protein KFE98_19175 [bacterium SCSIO 12741]